MLEKPQAGRLRPGGGEQKRAKRFTNAGGLGFP